MITWNHAARDLHWMWKDVGRDGAGLSWREPSSTHLTLKGVRKS